MCRVCQTKCENGFIVCKLHGTEWTSSGEFKRAKMIEPIDEKVLVFARAFRDFVFRRRAEICAAETMHCIVTLEDLAA